MKDIVIKEFKPLFNRVITTLDIYEEDVREHGVVVIPRGSVRNYQRVIAVGEFVRNINPGDLVLVNFGAYTKRMYKDNSVKNDEQKMIDTPVLDVPRITIDGMVCCKLMDNDIDGVITKAEEFEYKEQKAKVNNKLLKA